MNYWVKDAVQPAQGASRKIGKPSQSLCHAISVRPADPQKHCVEHSSPSFLFSFFKTRTSLVVQWLEHCAPNVEGLGLIPARSHVLQLRVCLLQLRLSANK